MTYFISYFRGGVAAVVLRVSRYLDIYTERHRCVNFFVMVHLIRVGFLIDINACDFLISLPFYAVLLYILGLPTHHMHHHTITQIGFDTKGPTHKTNPCLYKMTNPFIGHLSLSLRVVNRSWHHHYSPFDHIHTHVYRRTLP